MRCRASLNRRPSLDRRQTLTKRAVQKQLTGSTNIESNRHSMMPKLILNVTDRLAELIEKTVPHLRPEISPCLPKTPMPIPNSGVITGTPTRHNLILVVFRNTLAPDDTDKLAMLPCLPISTKPTFRKTLGNRLKATRNKTMILKTRITKPNKRHQTVTMRVGRTQRVTTRPVLIRDNRSYPVAQSKLQRLPARLPKALNTQRVRRNQPTILLREREDHRNNLRLNTHASKESLKHLDGICRRLNPICISTIRAKRPIGTTQSSKTERITINIDQLAVKLTTIRDNLKALRNRLSYEITP